MDDREVSEPKAAPYKGKLQVEAYESGKAAHASKKSRDECPEFPRRSLVECWLAGWDEVAAVALAAALAAREAEKARPPETPRPVHPLAFWPADKPLPTKYHRPPVPCTSCKRLLDDNGGRAVVLRFIDRGVAHFRCRATKGCPGCKLPVER